jgi:hypothetical protein
MDGVDTGALLTSLMGQGPQPSSSQGLTRTQIDNQILAALKAPAGPAAGSGPLDPDSPQAYAQAAQSAAQREDSTPQTLQLGFGPGAQINTHIPLPHWLANGLQGIGGETMRIGQGLTQTLGGQTDPLLHAVAQQDVSTPAGKAGAFLVDTALTAPIGGAATSGLARLGGVGARIAANAFGRAAAQGALQGAITADPGQRWQGAGLGAALSQIAPLVGSAVGKLATGLARTPEAQTLLDRGVALTPGQMNPEGAVTNRLEQALTHVPFIGGKIANARGAAAGQYTRSMVEDALAPGATLTPAPDANFNDLVANAQRGFDHAYDSTLRSTVPGGGYPMKPVIMNASGPDVPLSTAFAQLTSRARPGLLDPVQRQLGKNLQGLLANTLQVARQSGGLQADDLQQLRSSLRDAMRDVSPIDNASRAQRGFWNDAQQLVTQALKSQLPGKVGNALDDIDRQYSKFAIVRNVAKAAKDQPAGPTPSQWSTAIAQATPANQYTAGGGWNRDLTKAARSTFQQTVPHTGATGAGTIGPIVGGIEAAMHPAFIAAHPLSLGGIAGGLGALYGAYTKPGLRFLAGQSAPQRAVQGLLGSISPAAKEAIGRYGRAGLLGGLLGLQQQPAGLLAPP